MIFSALARATFWCAIVPAALFCWNLFYFRRPPARELRGGQLPKISVLIPARNEQENIRAAIECVLASEGVELELIVLDDASTDRTADIIHACAALDPRVHYAAAPAIAIGWAGKAHAAHALSSIARHDLFCFIDADVRISPQALARMEAFRLLTQSALVSGFPEEITITALEWLLLPLIQFLLLCYLPCAGLRHTNLPAFGAGCGQFQLMTRESYRKTGGYASVPATMHDGITLAKLFRRRGYHTDVADLTGLAQCRMYNSASGVWEGLTKNATEGIAAPARIVPFSLLLFTGQILPWPLLLYATLTHQSAGVRLVMAACLASLAPRLISIFRFRQSTRGALLHPLGVAIFLVLQWSALLQKLRGKQAVWKDRAFDVG